MIAVRPSNTWNSPVIIMSTAAKTAPPTAQPETSRPARPPRSIRSLRSRRSAWSRSKSVEVRSVIWIPPSRVRLVRPWHRRTCPGEPGSPGWDESCALARRRGVVRRLRRLLYARWARPRQLDDAELLVRAMVDIQVETQLLGVERLGLVHVRDGDQHQFELQIHDAPSLCVACWRRYDMERRLPPELIGGAEPIAGPGGRGSSAGRRSTSIGRGRRRRREG